MTQQDNNEALQEALKAYDERRTMTFLTSKGFFIESRDIEIIIKAAQAYADLVDYVNVLESKLSSLPEKIIKLDGGYKPTESEYYAYYRAKEDFLNLLKDDQGMGTAE